MVTTTETLKATSRYLKQAATMAVRDIYDAVVELVTNSDDRYQRLDQDGLLKGIGVIEIEVKRQIGKKSLLLVRDFADGMTTTVMDEKLQWLGGRVSGMEEGYHVRGTNSRGAKDVAALGNVSFQSIAEDSRFHRCEIDQFMDYHRFSSQTVTRRIRQEIGILKGTGFLVTIEVENTPIPRHDKFCKQLSKLVSLRDILTDPKRRVVVRDLNQGRKDVITAPKIEGVTRVKESFVIPGYPGASAKLVIKRMPRACGDGKGPFRLNGILVKSRHAIHEATFFEKPLEYDPYAQCFFGKLVCDHIDDLMEAFDARHEAKKPALEYNPRPVIDPSRQKGLTKDHPFVQRLFAQALLRLRPLVEEERQLHENQQSQVESRATRKRLDALSKAAAKFLQDFEEDEETSRHPSKKQVGSPFRKHGYALNPPFCQMICGHTREFWLNVRQEVFPDLKTGTTLRIDCMSPDIECTQTFSDLEPHPVQDGVLQARWPVKAVSATPATGLSVSVGSIHAESTIEVLRSEADKYQKIDTLRFGRKRYTVKDSNRKKVQVFAPLSAVPKTALLQVECTSDHFRVPREIPIAPNSQLEVAVANFVVKSDGSGAFGKLHVRLNGDQASAEISYVKPLGADIRIELEDKDFTNQRSMWRQNLLLIATRHPSVSRYLGSAEKKWPGQETQHFRLLLAEIVADAVCSKALESHIQDNMEEYEGADWNAYYAEYSKLMTQFLPIAHKLQCPEASGG